jgi:hypothetical protein
MADSDGRWRPVGAAENECLEYLDVVFCSADVLSRIQTGYKKSQISIGNRLVRESEPFQALAIRRTMVSIKIKKVVMCLSSHSSKGF